MKQENINLLIENVGGEENVSSLHHCFTRLRFSLRDTKKVNIQELKKLDEAVEVRFQGNELQIVIGNNVDKVFNEIYPYFLHLEDNETAGSNSSSEKGSILDRFLTMISSIFTPILPAIIGAGLMKGILSLLVLLKVLNDASDTYLIFNIIADTSFKFLPILISISAAKYFKTNYFLSAVLALSLFYPSLVSAAADGVTLRLFGLFPVPPVDYTSSVIPIILGVFVMSYVYRFFEKYIPKVVKMIFAPLLTMFIMIPLMLVVFGPLGYYVGQLLADFSLILSNNVPWLYGIIIGGFYPFIIMTSMHYAFFPMMLENINNLKYENGFLPIGLFANISMAGATFAVWVKSKNPKTKEVAGSSAISAVFGVTEPALYGIILKNKKVLYSVMAVSGVVSAVIMTLGIKMFSFVAPGILALPVFIDPETGSLQYFTRAVIGVVVCLVATFIAVFLTYQDSDQENVSEKSMAKKSDHKPEEGVEVEIYSPISGKSKNLSNCSDEVFASGAMGKGVILLPTSETLFAPFDGEVISVAETGHAIGLRSKTGVELLIHIGIDTVKMNGEGFVSAVQPGSFVYKGQKLLDFSVSAIESHQFSTEIPIIIVNSGQFVKITPVEENRDISIGDSILNVLA